MGDIFATIIYIALLLLLIAILAGVAFSALYTIFGVIPLALVNGLMALIGRRQRNSDEWATAASSAHVRTGRSPASGAHVRTGHSTASTARVRTGRSPASGGAVPRWALPYVGWGVSIAALTLLSIVANFQTNLKYGGSFGDWAGVTLVELALTAVGIALAWIAFAKQRSRVYAGSQVEDKNAAHAPIRAYVYWIVSFLGIFIINWIIDMNYILGLGVDIQGIGPGWIDLLDG